MGHAPGGISKLLCQPYKIAAIMSHEMSCHARLCISRMLDIPAIFEALSNEIYRAQSEIILISCLLSSSWLINISSYLRKPPQCINVILSLIWHLANSGGVISSYIFVAGSVNNARIIGCCSYKLSSIKITQMSP